MGKIKPIKSIRREIRAIVEKNPKDYLDFEKNKELVAKFYPDLSKRYRNIVAGFLVREAKKRMVR